MWVINLAKDYGKSPSAIATVLTNKDNRERGGKRSHKGHQAIPTCYGAAEDFATEFLETMTEEGYLPQQVFNCGETLLKEDAREDLHHRGGDQIARPHAKEGPSNLPVLKC
ncbi:hypothetical protein JRQ81_004134 [Phrynocephalus forsythii]|uniref:Uncharacterized protein n=1 Tax=Phrynocephalus forsythii TaxID=171643 RepID=A0A9Q1AXK7_9SAUR|nr:hypothetical protein JRQ81_004134 [Phrynocephalus forsythii]